MILDLNNPVHRGAIEEVLTFMEKARAPHYPETECVVQKIGLLNTDRPEKIDMAIRGLLCAAAWFPAATSTEADLQEADAWSRGVRQGWGYGHRELPR